LRTGSAQGQRGKGEEEGFHIGRVKQTVKSKESFESGQAFDGREFDDLVIGDAVDAERVLRRQGLDRRTVRGAAENDAARPGILRPRTEKRPCGILAVEGFAGVTDG